MTKSKFGGAVEVLHGHLANARFGLKAQETEIAGLRARIVEMDAGITASRQLIEHYEAAIARLEE